MPTPDPSSAPAGTAASPREFPESTGSWQQQLASAIRDPDQLCRLLDLPAALWPAARRAARLFPLVVPHNFLARMTPGDPHDPLLRQVLPAVEELEPALGFVPDPVGDHSSRKVPGLLQKYHGRVLLIVTGTCAIHCRYCFRRHYPYHEEPRRLEDWQPALQAVALDPTIQEVILSGGDPLVLSDDRLQSLIDSIAAISHVKRLRIHTRLPIVLPARVTDRLIEVLRETRPASIVVVHANHPREIAGDCQAGLRRMSRSGLTVLNQAVLLRGINDSASTLVELSERLVDAGVVPYYLHQLDRVAGAAHFEVAEAAGLELMAQLQRRLPGYAVPRFVREVPGADSKLPVAP